MYKAVICDLDGTLLNSKHTISEYTKTIISKIHAKGVKVFIATGRHHRDAVAFKRMLGLDSFLITSNGAKIHDEHDNEIFSHNIPADLASEIISFPMGEEFHRSIYQNDLWFVEEELEEAEEFHKESGFTHTKKDFNEISGEEVTKFFYICNDSEKLRTFEEGVIEKFKGKLNVTLSQINCLELMQRGVSKGTAIKEILAKEGISIGEAVAFGDGLNDLDMLSTVGKGLIMGNCNYKLQEALPDHEVIETNDEDGVAKYLAELFLD